MHGKLFWKCSKIHFFPKLCLYSIKPDWGPIWGYSLKIWGSKCKLTHNNEYFYIRTMEISSGGGCAAFRVMFLAAPIAPLLSSLPSLFTFFVNCLVSVLFRARCGSRFKLTLFQKLQVNLVSYCPLKKKLCTFFLCNSKILSLRGPVSK